MRKCISFLFLVFSLNLVAQNNHAQLAPTNYPYHALKAEHKILNDATPIAHPAKKEFPYDFELQTKDPNYNQDIADVPTEATPTDAKNSFLVCNFLSAWQPTLTEIKSMINETDLSTIDYKEVCIRINPIGYKRNFLSY